MFGFNCPKDKKKTAGKWRGFALSKCPAVQKVSLGEIRSIFASSSYLRILQIHSAIRVNALLDRATNPSNHHDKADHAVEVVYSL